MQGTVKFFNSEKGYGFIEPDNNGPDVFVHASALGRTGITLVSGQRVEFDTEPDKKGKGAKAKDLRILRE